MREIKFRGLDINGRWFYGLLSVSQGKATQPKQGSYISNKAGSPFAYQVRPETVGQYSGLKDSNDDEIYDGHIIEIGSESPPCLEIVTFREGSFETVDECENLSYVLRHNDRVMVVGNIFQHDVGLYGVTSKGFAS